MENASSEKLSRRNLWGYSLGGIGRDMIYKLVNTALMTFILITKNVTSADVAAITAIFLCCRIFDGANDPLMGAIIEKTRTKWGKFKPWIIIGCLTNIATVLALFFVPLTGTKYVIFFAFFYLLWGITYTMNDISYWGMMPSLTSNASDRNNISTLANVCAGIGAGIALGATSLFGYGDLANAVFGGTIKAYHIIAVVLCCIFAACQIMTCCVVKEKPLPPLEKSDKKKSGSLKRIFGVLFHNDQLMAIAGTMFFENIGAGILDLFACYWVWLRYGYQGLLVTVFSLLTACSSVIMIFYPLLSKKFSRRKIMTISFIAILVGYSLMLTLGLSTGAAHLSQQSDFICYFFIAICGTIAFFGQTLFYQVLTVSIANTVEYNDYKTGSRDEGAIFALRPFTAKLSSAICVGIQGLGLILLGINNVTKDISAVENEAYAGLISADEQAAKIADILGGADSGMSQWLIVFMTVIPTVFLTIAFIIYMKKYNITEERYAEICEAIRKRDKEKTKEGEANA